MATDTGKKFQAGYILGEVVNGKTDSTDLEKTGKGRKGKGGSSLCAMLLATSIALVPSTGGSFGGSLVLEFFHDYQ